MTNNIDSTFNKHELYVNEIVFYSKEEVSLMGFVQVCGKFFETEYIISRNQLQMLLSQTKSGIEILWRIETLFLLPHSSPACVNLIEQFGTTQIFEAKDIELDVAYETDETGASVPCQNLNVLFVENIIPFPAAVKSSL